MKPGSNNLSIICYSALIVCISVFCYVNTLFPSVYWLDSGELQAAVPTLGIPHSPSFPSYLLVSHWISWIPLGDIAYRLNLATALAATIVGVLTFFLALQLFGSITPLDRFSSFFTACLVTLNPQVWFQSIKAEVYSLNTVWLMGLLICVMGIIGNPDDRKKIFRFACVAALFLGLGLTNHSLLTVHIIPALIIPGFFCVRKLRLREILVPGQILILMLSTYLYLPIRSNRDPMIDIGNPESYLNFINAVTRKGSFNRFFGNVISEWIGNWSEYFNLIRENFSAGFFAIACIGLVFMFLRNKKQMTFLFVAAITNLSVTLMNRNFNMNPDTGPAYLMLSTIIFIICVGASMRVLLLGLSRYVQSRMIVRVATIAISIIPMVWILEGFQRMGNHEDFSAGQVGRAIMDTCPQDSVLFFGMYYNLPFVVSYLQAVEKYRTDIVGISRGEVVYWSGGLENVSKRYPGLTTGIFAGEYGELLSYLAPRGARNSGKVSFEEARMLLFNATAWIAQEQSEFRDVFWFSSEDDHLIKNYVEAFGPMLRFGSSLLVAGDGSTDPSMIIARRVLLREKLKFSMTRGAQVLAAFYDQQCVTLTARNELQQAVAARVWRMSYDPQLAGFCD